MTNDQSETEDGTPTDDPYAEIRPENYYDDLEEDEWNRFETGPKARFEFEKGIRQLRH